MAAVTETETQVVAEIGNDYKYGFHEKEDYFFKSGRGLSPELVAAISEHKNEPEWMRKFRLRSLDYFLARPLPEWGGNVAEIDFDNIFYYIKPDREAGQVLGGSAAGHPRHLEQARDPRGGEEVPGGRRRPVRERGRLPQAQGGAGEPGRALPRHGLGASRARGHRQAVHGHGDPSERQQVRRAELGRLVGWLVHLRAAGRQGRDAAPGLLPHQRGEHGPVRAHADHRRRGRLRALRRGLHRADLLERLAALGGRRDHRQARRPLPLHDDPELVEQRLQPRHQAGRRLRERDDGVGRRQPRLQADDEVPGDLAGRARARTARCSRSPSPATASTRTRAASASTSRRARRP